jgi:hypothetical protein
VWYDPVRVKVLTDTRGNLFSHSTLARIVSSFSKVGVSRRLAQVSCLPKSAISQRSRLLIIALNMNGHRKLKLSLFFSSLRQMILKSPPMIKGRVLLWHWCLRMLLFL